jgi:hypothetical protein
VDGARCGRAFGDTCQTLNKGSHVVHARCLGLLVRDARALASKILDGYAVTAEGPLVAARRLVEHPDAATAGICPPVAALLTRQALELALAGVWAAAMSAAAGLDRSSIRSQLLCLTVYLDGDTVTRAAYLYPILSRACHYHLSSWPSPPQS